MEERMRDKPRIYADFQCLDDRGRVRLDRRGTHDDLRRLGIVLREGMAVTFYMDDADSSGKSDDLEVDGIVRFDSAEECWVGEFDRSRFRHASDR